MPSRMKAHWPERLNPILELRSATRWLQQELRYPSTDIYRCLAICEAVNILQDCIDTLHRESEMRSACLREYYKNNPSVNPFDSEG